MKNILFITIALALVSTTAFASKARLISLGEDSSGSFFIEDSRDFFLNPAHIHSHGNQIIFETGSTDHDFPTLAGAGAAGKIDIDTDPVAEGGFISLSGNTAYGIYFGQESNAVSERRFLGAVEGGGSASAYVAQDNVVDFFYGKDSGTLKWAAGLQYSDSKDQTADKSQTSINGRFGVIKDQLEVYTKVGLKNDSKFTTHKFEGKHGVEVGAIKHVNNLAYYLAVQSTAQDIDSTLDPEISTQKIQFFVGNTKKVNETVNLYFKSGIVNDSIEVKGGSQAALSGKERKDLTLPVSVAVEVKTKEWLTLRGSISQNIYGQRDLDGKKISLDNSTNVNAGAGLHFGDLTIDGMIGTGKNTAGTAITSTTAENGILSTDNLLTRVSMTYKF